MKAGVSFLREVCRPRFEVIFRTPCRRIEKDFVEEFELSGGEEGADKKPSTILPAVQRIYYIPRLY